MLCWHLERWDVRCARKNIEEGHNWVWPSIEWGDIKSLFHVLFPWSRDVGWFHKSRYCEQDVTNFIAWLATLGIGNVLFFGKWKQHRREKKTQETIFKYFHFSLSLTNSFRPLLSGLLLLPIVPLVPLVTRRKYPALKLYFIEAISPVVWCRWRVCCQRPPRAVAASLVVLSLAEHFHPNFNANWFSQVKVLTIIIAV